MNLTIDIGNTAVKWATFEGHALTASGEWSMADAAPFGGAEKVGRAMACASGDAAMLDAVRRELSCPLMVLDADTPLPIELDYKTPRTLGPDRVAAACGAWALHAGDDCLVVDAGTCITVDFLSADGVYHGGAIMPGLRMGLQALHSGTARLPLVSLEGVKRAPVLGRSTEECILAGTLGATMLALAGYVALYRQRCPHLRVLLTGGDADLLATGGAEGWERQPHLTHIGLNEILTYNDNEKTR
jgi:type III pantothenate kinase